MLSMHPGRFIVIEGPEGAGKSTQARRLQQALGARELHVVRTHEPGGTPAGQAIREVLLDARYRGMSALAELFLVCASRAEHVAQVIRPALEAGKIVICDRFSPSTIVYQGHAGRVSMEVVEATDRAARQGLLPNLTVILDVPAETGLSRGLAGGVADRMESKEVEFHRRVREGYLRYAETAPEKCVVISSERPEHTVADEVLSAVLGVIDSSEG